MPVIDLVKWNGNPNILAWKFPYANDEELSTWTQLIVNETQEAFLVKEGIYQGPFGAGRHTLSTENIPLLRKLIGIPFGGKSPFTAEVWFVNKTTNLDIKWGTPDPIQLQDPKYQIMVPVRAFGQFGILIADAKKFLLKLVGTSKGFDSTTLTDYFRGVFITKIKTEIANAIIKNGKSVLEISTDLELLSDSLRELLSNDMDEYGLSLSQFNIHSINVPEEDPAVISLKAALAKKAEMGIIGFNYQQERSFNVLEAAAGNEGTSGNVMGAGIGMGMGFAMGGPMGNSLSQITPNLQTNSINHIFCKDCNTANPENTKFCCNCGHSITNQSSKKKFEVTCDKCGTLIPKSSRFCPNCADSVNACPSCGDDNPNEAKLCRSCGEQMPLICNKCNATVIFGSKFCSKCGEKTYNSCENCNTELSLDTKFCNNCGHPQA
jgi:membrane protease subunit (stomatin/prohibitin family)